MNKKFKVAMIVMIIVVVIFGSVGCMKQTKEVKVEDYQTELVNLVHDKGYEILSVNDDEITFRDTDKNSIMTYYSFEYGYKELSN